MTPSCSTDLRTRIRAFGIRVTISVATLGSSVALVGCGNADPAGAANPLELEGPERESYIRALANDPSLLNLVDALDSDSILVRQGVCEASALMGKLSEPLTDALISCLRDPDPEVRSAAVKALGTHRIELAPKYAELLTRSDPVAGVRFTAAWALGRLDTDPSATIAALTHALKEDEDPWVRRQAVESLRRFRLPEDTIDALISLLGEPSGVVPVVRTLASVGPEVVPHLESTLLGDDRSASTKAVDVLALIGKSHPRVLVDLLRHNERQVYFSVGFALQEVGSQAVHELTLALEGDDVLIQERAARVLGSFGHKASPSLDALEKGTASTTTAVRNACFEALASLGQHAASKQHVLIQGLGNPSAIVRAHAARGIGNIGSKASEATSAVADLLNDTDPVVRKYSVQALGNLGAGEKGALIADRLGDEDVRVRRAASQTLKLLGNLVRGGVAMMTKALEDPDVLVRRAIAVALERVETLPSESLAALENSASHDPDRQVRLSAAAAVRRHAKRQGG